MNSVHCTNIAILFLVSTTLVKIFFKFVTYIAKIEDDIYVMIELTEMSCDLHGNVYLNF
jgi:hypothetical protein